MEGTTPWILAFVVLLTIILILGGLYFFLGREVGAMRQEIIRLGRRKDPVPAAPPPPPPEQGVSPPPRVDLEAPPSDWPDLDARVLPPPSGDAQVFAMYPVRVKILAAQGHVPRPAYCVCQIKGRPQSKVATRVVDGAPDVTWDHEVSMLDFCQGDTLSFLVYVQDRGRADELLGEALLTGDRFLDRDFDDALPLTQARAGAGPAGPWTCERCTMQNSASARRCVACEAERPPQAAGPAATGVSLRVQASTAVWDPNTTPLFTARWAALDAASRTPAQGEFLMRNDWDGEVGFRFRTRTAVVVVALGRQTLTGGLRDNAVVTLWSDDTQAELAATSVGPTSHPEGGYAFSSLRQPLLLEADKEFRITQHCFPGMADPWFDGCAEPAHLSRESSSRNLEFLGSVYHGGRSFPSLVDRERCEYRRAGMVNLKLLGQDPAAEAERFRHGGAQQVALQGAHSGPAPMDASEDAMQIRLICMSPAPKGQPPP
mmetsp:Transcript_140542/g.437057  ORF Transcript_140542/g.437057 Transcript_140542/m.437057 type:complete len:487 (-) Transcript_140542:27-1487(-)